MGMVHTGMEYGADDHGFLYIDSCFFGLQYMEFCFFWFGSKKH